MTASIWPAASIGSRTGLAMVSIFTLAVSMLLTLANTGHCAAAGSCRRRAQPLAFQILRGGDAAALAADHGIGRPVVEHEHGLDRRLGIGVAVFDQRVDVGKGHVELARGHPGDRLEHVFGRRDADIDACSPVPAAVERQQEGRRGAVDGTVEAEADGGFGGGGRWRRRRRPASRPRRPSKRRAERSWHQPFLQRAYPHAPSARGLILVAQKSTCVRKEQDKSAKLRCSD